MKTDFRQPVVTIGQIPFAAGAIFVRNEIRAHEKRERARRREALRKRFEASYPNLERWARTIQAHLHSRRREPVLATT